MTVEYNPSELFQERNDGFFGQITIARDQDGKAILANGYPELWITGFHNQQLFDVGPHRTSVSRLIVRYPGNNAPIKTTPLSYIDLFRHLKDRVEFILIEGDTARKNVFRSAMVIYHTPDEKVVQELNY